MIKGSGDQRDQDGARESSRHLAVRDQGIKGSGGSQGSQQGDQEIQQGSGIRGSKGSGGRSGVRDLDPEIKPGNLGIQREIKPREQGDPGAQVMHQFSFRGHLA